jgi:protein phosphatase
MKTKLSVYGVCNIGLKKPNNEDMVLLGDEIFRDSSRKKEFESVEKVAIAVADGIGGLGKGEVASETVLTRLRDMLAKIPNDLSNDKLKEAFDNYAQETHNFLLQSEGGSTLVGILAYNEKVFRFHAGDSRIYLMRDGGLRRLTVDHSLRESGNQPNAQSNMITNSLGGGKNTFIEFAEIEQPFVNNDTYLLCSDGLHGMISLDDLIDTLLQTEAELGEAVAERLLALAKAGGGKDNISVVTVKVLST